MLALPPFRFIDDFGENENRFDRFQILCLHEVVTPQHADHEDIGEIFAGAPLQIVFDATDNRELDTWKRPLKRAGSELRSVGAMHVHGDLTFRFGALKTLFPFLLPRLARFTSVGETNANGEQQCDEKFRPDYT